MYNVFLAGPWEKYASDPYKQQFKAAFPAITFYDPEDHQEENWFERNLYALRQTQILVVYVPSFPFPGVGPEVGIYFERRTLMGRVPLIVAIWPDNVQPQWGREVLGKMGVVVPTVKEAIDAVNALLGDQHATHRPPGYHGYKGNQNPLPR